MEILKVGDELLLSGYKSITLSGDMSKNVSSFAQINGITETEAEKILNAVPALKNFASSLTSVDADDDVVVVGDFVDDSNDLNMAKAGSAEQTKAGATAKTGTLTAGGVTFEFSTSGAAPTVKTSGNTVTVTGDNATVTIKSVTNKNAIIHVKGSNLTVNSTATVKQIVNYAKNSTINGSDGNDNIDNRGEGSTINAGKGNDTIANRAKNSKINGGDGNDKITNYSAGTGTTVDGGAGNDTIKNNAVSSTINGGDGNDTITNSGKSVKINGGAGNDTIKNTGVSATVHGNDGNDNITSSGKSSKIYGDAGNDTIKNTGASATVDGGRGNDTITSSGSGAKISGGLGNDNITSTGSKAVIDLKDGNDTVKVTKSNSTIKNVESGDKITGKATISARLTSVKEGEVGSLSYFVSKMGIQSAAVKDYETNNDGQVTKVYMSADGKDFYTLSYASGSMTVTHSQSGKNTEMSKFSAKGVRTQYDKYAYDETGSVTFSYTNNEDGSNAKLTITGKTTSGTVKYTVVDSRPSTVTVPELNGTSEKLTIKFNGGKTITVQSGEKVNISSTGAVSVTKNGTTTTYTADGIGIQQGADKIGSKEYLKKLDSSLDFSKATDVVYDANGRISSFNMNAKIYTISYIGKEVKITSSANLASSFSSSFVTEEKTYNDGTIAKLVVETTINAQDGSKTTLKVDKTYTSGKISGETSIETKYDKNNVITGTITSVSSNYNSSGVPASIITKGYNGEENSENLSWTITDNYQNGGYPKYTAGTATEGTISFSDSKSIKIKDGSSAVIASDGTVTVTSKDGKTVTKYDKTGKEIMQGTTTTTTVTGGTVDTRTDVDDDGNTTSTTYTGHTTTGATTYTITNNSTTATPSVTTTSATTAEIAYGDKKITVADGDRATIAKDGKMTVTRKDGATEVFRADGTQESYSKKVTSSDGSSVEETRKFNADGSVKEIKINSKDKDGNSFEDVKSNYNDNGTYTHTIKGTDKNGRVNYQVTLTEDGKSAYPKFEASANDVQIKLSDGASFTVNYGSVATFNKDGSVKVEQMNGVEVTYSLNADKTLKTDVKKPTTHYAPSTPSENNNETKDILGLFGLSVDSKVESLTKTDEKIELTVNGVKYTATIKDGVVMQIQKGNETPKVLVEPDPIDVINDKIANKKEEIYLAIYNLLAPENNKEIAEPLKKVLDQAIQDFLDNKSIGYLRYHISNLMGLEGYSSIALRSALNKNTSAGIKITNLCDELINLFGDKKKIVEEIEAKPTTTQIVTVGDTTFRVTMKKPSSLVTKVEDGKYTISDTLITQDENGNFVINNTDASNGCKIEALEYGELGHEIIINGSAVEFNANALTATKITNNAEGAKVTGSHGDDVIVNNAKNAIINGANGNDNITNNGQGAKINGNAGDDTIVNNAANAVIHGNEGNDTVINYGANASLFGDEGADAINYVNGTATPTEKDSKDVHVGKILRDETKWEATADDNVTPVVTPVEPSEPAEPADPCEPAEPSQPATPADGTYKNSKQFTVRGITFTVYSNSEIDESVYSTDNYNGVKINISNAKVVINSTTKGTSDNTNIVRFEGSNLDIQTEAQLYGLYNYAKDSKIQGSDKADAIFNYANNVEIDGGKGNDTLSNNGGSNVKLTGSDGNDKFWNMSSSGKNVTVVADSSDSGEIKGAGACEVTVDCPGGGCSVDLPSECGTSASPSSSTATLTSVKTYMSASSAFKAIGVDSEAEFTTFINKYYGKSGYTSYNNILTLIKQIEVIYENSDKDTQTRNSLAACMTGASTFNNEILADANIILNAKAAGSVGSTAYNNSIKSQMVKNGKSNASTGDVYTEGGKLYYRTGTGSNDYIQLDMSADTYVSLFQPIKRFIVEQANHDDCFFLSTTLVDLMENPQTRGTVLKMFSENSNGDITVTFPGLSNYPVTFTNGNLRTTSNIVSSAKGNQMLEQAYAIAKFSEVVSSTISIDDIKDLHSAELATAVQSARNNSSVGVTDAMKYYEGGWFVGNGSYKTDRKTYSVTGIYKDLFPYSSSSQSNIDATKTSNITALASKVASNNYAVSVKGKASETLAKKYNLSTSTHQYDIESIDVTNKMVYIKNPWDSYRVTGIPFSDFVECFTTFDWIQVA